MGRKVQTAQTGLDFGTLFCGLDDHPNGLEIMRGWSGWKTYSLSLNKVKAFMRIAHYFLLQQTYKARSLHG